MSKGSGGGGKSGRSGGGGHGGATDPGLESIKADIQKAGGPEKYFKKEVAPNAETLSQSDFSPVSSKTLTSQYGSQIKGKTPFKTDGDIKYFQGNGNTVIATSGEKVVGYGKSYTNFARQRETDFSVAKEAQGKGIGTKLMKTFYGKNPESIKYPGGFTPAGKKAFMSMLKSVVS